MSEADGVGRRGFIQAGLVALGVSDGGRLAQVDFVDDTGPDYRQAPYLIGTRAARPAAGGSFFEDKTYGAYIYEAFDGARWGIRDPFDNWVSLNRTNRVWVHSEADLPEPSNGTISLENGRVYSPVGYVTHEYPLELATTSPLVGVHGGLDGFIYTGAGTGRGAAIQGTDANFFMRDLYLHAPGATLLDLTANQSTEMLVESYSTNDAANLGNAANLGTIDGYRVPTFKGCNFGAFDSGLTFDGTSNKIAFFECPIRNISASGVDALTLASSASVEFIDMGSCYFKDVQSDSVFWRLDSRPTEALQLRGTLIDPAATFGNIIVDSGGNDLRKEAGIVIATSFPLADSDVGGSIDDTNGPQTVTGSGSGAVRLGSTNLTTTLSTPERTSMPSDGILQYDGRRNRTLRVFATATVTGSNTEYEIGIVVNGLPASGRTEANGFITNANTPDTTATVGEFEIQPGDQISLSLENVGGTADLEVETFSLTV